MFKEAIVYEICYAYRKCNETMKILVRNFNFWTVITTLWADAGVDVFGPVVGLHEKLQFLIFVIVHLMLSPAHTAHYDQYPSEEAHYH